MPKLKAIVRYPRPDIKATENEIHKAMSQYVVDQLRVWVVATTEPIPVLTGAAKASFTYLAEQARIGLSINPTAPSRVDLGIAEATSNVLAERDSGLYGWTFMSTLVHLPIVESRVSFFDAGQRALANAALPTLPPIVVTQ